MKRRGPPSLLEIANRLAEVLAKKYFGAFKGSVPFDELRSFAGVGAAEALRKWNQRGSFDHFAAQRIRWAILRLVRRQILRHLPEAQRHEGCALVATERTADSYDRSPDEAPVPLPTPTELADEAAWEYRAQLHHADEAAEEVADPRVDLDFHSDLARLRRAIKGLPPPENVIVERHLQDEETIGEIAESLSMRRSTVHDAYKRGIRRLVEMLEPKPPRDEASAVGPSLHP